MDTIRIEETAVAAIIAPNSPSDSNSKKRKTPEPHHALIQVSEAIVGELLLHGKRKSCTALTSLGISIGSPSKDVQFLPITNKSAIYSSAPDFSVLHNHHTCTIELTIPPLRFIPATLHGLHLKAPSAEHMWHQIMFLMKAENDDEVKAIQKVFGVVGHLSSWTALAKYPYLSKTPVNQLEHVDKIGMLAHKFSLLAYDPAHAHSILKDFGIRNRCFRFHLCRTSTTSDEKIERDRDHAWDLWKIILKAKLNHSLVRHTLQHTFDYDLMHVCGDEPEALLRQGDRKLIWDQYLVSEGELKGYILGDNYIGKYLMKLRNAAKRAKLLQA